MSVSTVTASTPKITVFKKMGINEFNLNVDYFFEYENNTHTYTHSVLFTLFCNHNIKTKVNKLVVVEYVEK